MVKSKILRGFRTTVPLPVRLALGLQPGDDIYYEIEESGRVVMKPMSSTGRLPTHSASTDSWDAFFDEEGVDLSGPG